MKACIFIHTIILFLATACTTSRISIADKKYPPAALQQDYKIFRGALEESHPSLYWFTPKDSMDLLFDQGHDALRDSMTEREFRMILQKVITGIRCGHTAVTYSKKYSRYLDTAQLKLFPLSFKVWPDSLAVIGNLNPRDSIFSRGTIVTAIDGHPAKALIDTFLQYVTTDGHAITGKYQSLSSFGTFGILYKNIYGARDTFAIRYINELGFESEARVGLFTPKRDSLENADSVKVEQPISKDRRKVEIATRDIQVDTVLKSAYMQVNTFARGNKVRKFFRYAFKNIGKLNIRHLVIDVRSNGGGDAGNAIFLTQFLTDHPFVVADSLYAIKRSSRYRDYIKLQPLYWLATLFITHKKSDGNFHFGYFERHTFQPRRKHHYNGKVYILTGGNSFSATTIFAQELKGQSNVKIVGEETGGGAYGNTAWILSELVLPITRVKISIPKFRFVMRKELVKEGRGVQPDVYAAPTAHDIKSGIDVKIQTVKRLIYFDHIFTNQ